jgi:hypothetical protein
LGKLGAALKSGDINAAQQAAQGLGHRHQHGQEAQATNSTQAVTDPGFMQLIAQSLATTLNNTQPQASSTGDASQATQAIGGAQNVSQTLSAFMQQLMTALESKNAASSATTTSNAGQGSANSPAIASVVDADGDNDGSKFQQALTSANAFQGPPSPKFNSYMQAMGGQIKTNLDNLLQQLSGGSSSDNSSTAALQNSFSSFIGALGGQADNSTLTSFLQNMQKNLQYGSTSGNLLNITA